MTFHQWLALCPVPFEIDELQGFDGVSVAFYPPVEEDMEEVE